MFRLKNGLLERNDVAGVEIEIICEEYENINFSKQ